MNVFENVSMGMDDETLKTLGHKEVGRRVWQALELVNLEPTEVLSKLPAELSGGMRKRVGIARAIVGRPAILLWDEPTTGLDPINTTAVERLIQRLSRELEVTSLVVTHDIEGGLLICDRVAMLEGGRLRFCGTPEEFRSSDDAFVQAFQNREAAERALDMADHS
jgi:phospholipid/cholesterol/gamma-HCH transport system ATP-binding protein